MSEHTNEKVNYKVEDLDESPLQQPLDETPEKSKKWFKKSKDKKEKKEKKPSIPIHRLFRFSTPKERAMMFVASICSIATGALIPCSIIIYGSYISTLTSNLSDPSRLVEVTLPIIHTMAYIGTAIFVAAYIANSFWVITGENQTRRIRTLYVHSILRQDMSWFDKSEEGSLTTRLATDTEMIQDGISEKFGQFLATFAQFAAAFIVAFIKGWRLAVVMLAFLPCLAITGAIMGVSMSKYARLSQASYAKGGAIVEQVLHSVRTVYSFSLQNRFLKRFDEELNNSLRFGVKRGIVFGIGFGFFMFFMFSMNALAFWYGAKLVIEKTLDGSVILIVFMAMIMGCFSLLQLPQTLSSVTGACGAAYSIFGVIDRVPEIDSDSKEGLKLTDVKGQIEFDHVMFKYPTRPELTILKDFSLKVEPGKTIAFVGPSGSGKSTSIQLLQRFYDPLSGQIKLDGHNLKDLNVAWLRQQIGVVSQEPVLFNMTIRQNILMGSKKEVSNDELISICKEANCHTFITQLPQGYDTPVGEHGGMLSGGQKQRIAIARALLKNPKILLLDEATSALDTQSERLVQSALDKATVSRTTFVVAHRLSTIRYADEIIVMDHGNIIEHGTHNQLIEKDGVYADLVRKQAINTEEDTSSVGKDTIINETTNIAELEKLETVETRNSYLKRTESVIDVDAYDVKLKKKKEERARIMKQSAPMWKVIKLMRPEWKFLASGVCSAIVSGAIFPCYSYIFAHVINLLTVEGSNIPHGPMEGSNLYSFIFFMLAIAALIFFSTLRMSFEVAGEKFTKRMRVMVFEAYMRQEVGFYDEDKNSVGALVSKLAVDAKNVNELVTKVWGEVIMILVGLAVGLGFAFSSSWALTLVNLVMVPFIAGATLYEFRVHKGYEDQTKVAYVESSEVAAEAFKEIRTVAGLDKQDHFEQRYFHATERPHRLTTRKAYMSSIGYSMNKAITIYTNAITFYAGVNFIAKGMITFLQMFTTIQVIMTTAENLGRGSMFILSYVKAKFAAISVFELLERIPEIDGELEGIEPTKSQVRGDIDFKNVEFRYPARPDIPIFRGEFNLNGKAGQTIALVGPSGCGKSTTIGLLQRWYDSSNGSIALDDTNVKSYTLPNLRSHMSIVGQEPVLFDMSLKENIEFGINEDTPVTQEEVESACQAANIHKFITSLPDGYNTRVGDKGSQLSGGQKQRVAIARALIRKPRVLLLDEATSALDSDSEKLVQEAIDNILEQGGRTTITIAHRLSTIQNADLICVVKDGRIIEQGTHWELLKLNGVYYNLVQEQSFTST